MTAQHCQDAAPPESWTAVDWAVIALVAAPFVVGAIAIMNGASWNLRLVGDNAINELRIRDVGHHAVLLGPYSRDGWNHPGPAMYYLLALPYRLFGTRSAALLIATLLINGVSAAGIVVIARRTAGRALMLPTALGLSVLTIHLGAIVVRDPWNPYLTVLPFGALIFSSWALACGRLWHLPVTLGLASFVVQSHIGYAPLVGALVLWAVGTGAVHLRRERRSQSTPGPLAFAPILVTITILGVMWAGPVIDQLTDTGNLNTTRIYFSRGTATKGIADAVRVVGDVFTLTPDWLVGSDHGVALSGEPASLFRTPFPALGIIMVLVIALAWRRQQAELRQLAIAAVVVTVASLLTVAETTGRLYDYRLRFLWVLGVLAAATTVAMALHAWLPGRYHRMLTGLLLATLVATTTIPVAAATTTEFPGMRYSRRMAVIDRKVLAHLPKTHGEIVVRAASYVSALYLPALFLRLEEAGLPVRVDPFKVLQLSLGRHRLADLGRVRGVLTIADGQAIDQYAARTDQLLIAYWGGESRRDRTRDLARLRLDYIRTRNGDRSPALRREVRHLVRATDAIAVYFSRPS